MALYNFKLVFYILKLVIRKYQSNDVRGQNGQCSLEKQK